MGHAVAEDIEPTPGQLQLPGYEFADKIGEGGMATVFKGRQLSLDRPVAIKVLSQHMARHDQVYEAFEREAVIIARLSHPNIIHVIDRGISEQGMPFFIMEYIDGVDLATLIREGQLPLQKKVEICLQVCKALSYAHKNGVIHRDVKPANVLLDNELNAKVLDFGIALLSRDEKDGDDSGIKDGSERDVMGTFNYMAPELSDSVVQATFKSDIYSLGVVMYELFAGHLPSQAERVKPAKETALPTSVGELIMACLNPNPEKRPHSMIDIYDRLLLQLRGSHLDKKQIKRANDSVNNRKTFSLLDVIRENQYGAVYLFIEKNSGNQFVVKKTTGSFEGFDTAQRLAKLSHPHIARIHGASKNDRAFIVVMDYLKGGCLQDRLAQPYELNQFLHIARQISQGVLYAHGQQIIHGGLRPSNVLFDENDKVKLTGFGMRYFPIENETGEDRKNKRKWKSMRYRLPQEPRCPQTDIYACGMIFYLMLIGSPPRFRDDILQIGRAFKRLPQALQQLLTHMLKRNVTERPGHMKEVILVLDQFSTDMPTQVWQSGVDIADRLNAAAEKGRRKKIALLLLLLVLIFSIINTSLLLFFDEGVLGALSAWWEGVVDWYRNLREN